MPARSDTSHDIQVLKDDAAKSAHQAASLAGYIVADVDVRIVTGISGAGKSTALRVFEDLGYFTVDGLPANLVPEMIAMMEKPSMRHFRGIALGMDMRQENFTHEIIQVLEKLAGQGIRPDLLFLEAEVQELVRRYATTRRPHPLEREGIGLEAAINAEMQRLDGVRKMANTTLDTSNFSIHDLRRAIQQQWSQREAPHTLHVHIVSFGFKYGVPREADYVFDMRFLPNPYFIEGLRPLSGRDKAVADYVFADDSAKMFKEKFMDFLQDLLPRVEAEGRYRVTVAIGCTGGRHRSVAMAEELSALLMHDGYPVSLEHRHFDLG